MKIRSVKPNNHKHAFEVKTWRQHFVFPFAKAHPTPSAQNPVAEIALDAELGNEAFTYILSSGGQGTIHLEQVLEYNQDPAYMRNLLLYKLTIEAQNRLQESPLSKREIIRRLGTSPSQFYRLLDATNNRKSVDKILALLHVLDCEVDLIVRPRSA